MVSLIKVKDGVASREPIPDFLDRSGTPEALASLLDLSWTDPTFGLLDAAWWPEEDVSGELGTNKKWGSEVFTLDAERKVVKVARKQVAMTAAEKAARDALIQAEITATFEQAIQARLNEAAIAARYDSIATAVSYAEEPAVPKFQNDGKAFRAWRSLIWAYAYEQLALVLAGGREQPTADEFLAELPALELPV